MCIQCAQGYFLKRNECVKIEETGVVANCEEQFDNGICKKCSNGFMWLQNNCF